MAAANTGKESNNKIDVINIDHKYKGMRRKVTSACRNNKIVAIKFIAPIKEEIPVKWRLTIVRSTAPPG